MLLDVVRRIASSAPDHHAVVTSQGSLTYEQLVARSEGFARGLASGSIQRAACLVSDPAELVALLCASSMSGSELCVYSPTLDVSQVNELTAAFDHQHLITDQDLDGLVAERIEVRGLAVDDGAPPPGGGQAPVLILTTGTTGRPKGARHDWARLCSAVRKRSGEQDERWLLAYNLNQFAGIQVLLHVLIGGATLVVPPSIQPRDAIRAMRELDVTHVSATPTFWRFVVALLDDESTAPVPLQQITLGGEAVPAGLLDDLARVFPGVRTSQVYASTELGSSVSVRDGRNGLPVSVLERGDQADVQFRIVDGELHARSRVGMLGYSGQADEEGWRPTGDLVEVQGDRIVFVGRTSEIINVGGVKVHPLPIEEIVAAVEGVAVARVFGRTSALTGQIVAVDIVTTPGADTDLVVDAVRMACEGLPAASQPRRIKVVESLEVRENKVMRRADGAPRGAR